MTILLCDTGGTHIRFALSDDGKAMSEPQKFKLDEFLNLESVATHFLYANGKQPADITSFKLSFGGQNPWDLSEETVRTFLPNAHYTRVNDFEANAWGIAFSDEDHFLLLNTPEGTCNKGASKIVLGSGTGLGLAYILTGKKETHVQRTHGGHFFPAMATEEHRRIFEEIQKFKKTPSVIIYEDILSGPGIYNLYSLLAESTHTHVAYRDTNDLIERGRNDPLVEQALRIYHEVLGIFIHQVVACGFSYGGVYLTGGIIDRLVGHNLFDMQTVDKFFKQDNVEGVIDDMRATPIYWVKDEFIALKGLLEIDQ